MVESRIIQIGNSRGVRIPKALLEQAGITDEVSMEARDGEIVLRVRKAHPRDGWREAARAMHAIGDDAPLWPEDMEDRWADEP